MTNSNSDRLPRTKENFRAARLNIAKYNAAQATADWLVGKQPKAIHSYPRIEEDPTGIWDWHGTSFVELGTDPQPFVTDGGCLEYRDRALCALAMNEALVMMAGSAAMYAHPFDRRLFPNCYDFLISDFNCGRAHLAPVCVSANENLSIAYTVWDGALTLFRHPRVWACVEELAKSVVRKNRIDNVNYEIESHFEAHLAGLEVPPFTDGEEGDDVSVICWPKKGIAEFSSPNWDVVMVASSAKGRAHYVRAS